MPAGYSTRTAAQKLGVRPGSRLALLAAPPHWTLPGIPDSVTVRRDLRGHRQVVVAFVRTARALRRDRGRLDRAVGDDVRLWIAWPRRAGGHDSDVTEQLLRDVLLPCGLVDTKVAAIDADWSGLQFVRRRELRGR